MTLLFDENLSPKLVIALADQFPGSCHVDRVGLGSEDDNSVWKYAQQNNLTLVSKDSDFQEKSLLYGYPPKVSMRFELLKELYSLRITNLNRLNELLTAKK
ncbi:MAG: DUF5615 family PIN-like protein [Parvibaculum sp.]|nr:DUF5615 family PIN-like protein [Parvibaculum sp.]